MSILLLGACEAEPPPGRSGGLRLAAVLGESDAAAGFARAEQPRPFVFPADHAAHPAYRSEWWYLTLALRDVNAPDQEFGVQFTVFRQALTANAPQDDPWRNGQAYLAHFALTDVARGEHREHERMARGHPRLAGTRHAPFSVWLEDWSLTQVNDGVYQLVTREGNDAVQLELEVTRPLVARGEAGLSRKGPGQASFYYSMTRMSVTGTLTTADGPLTVEGLGWFDHEWSTSVLSSGQVGWDWFALMLDDGTDVSAFRLRRRDGERDPHDHGVLVNPDGQPVNLGPERFRLTPLQFWRDDRKVRWPVRWQLDFEQNGQTRQLVVAALLDDQRMDTLLTYWEGLVEVQDSDGQRIGVGYMELTGY